ncbi:MAG TPA: TonB-dependent receptor [Halieaceae bacterium]|nr:TonB-dependent receptor [Halieaceae bacterium]
MKNTTFNRSRLASAVSVAIAVSGMAVALPAAAQEEAEVMEEVIVTGYRKSLMDSIENKRESGSIIESISAEDIGKLPDSSIAESLARLPGLAAQRLDGRASRISIRGFGENESATTFNGREQVSISDNRGVEFDLYPSEIMAGVDVYKTPDANLEAEGIAGVIDMRTIKPLDTNSRMSVRAEYERNDLGQLNPDADEAGLNATFSYIDQFADGTLGVAFAHAMLDSPNQENRWNAWGYLQGFTDSNGAQGDLLGGAKPFVRSSTLERDSTMLVVQYEPNERVSMTADALYVDFSDQKILRGVEIPFGWGQMGQTITIDDVSSDGIVSQATSVGHKVLVRNDYEERNAELSQFGFNVEVNASDNTNVVFDVSRSEVERDIYSMESYAGTGRGTSRGAGDTITYNLGGEAGATFSTGLDYTDRNLIQLGGQFNWGGTELNDALAAQYGDDFIGFEGQGQDGFINVPEIDDELTSIKISAETMIDSDVISSIEYGVSVRERDKTKLSAGFYMTLGDFPNTGMISDQYHLGSVELAFLGIPGIVAYDSRAMVNGGVFDLIPETSSHATRSWTVSEDLTAGFVMANIDSTFAGKPISGNVGFRYVHTEQSSLGNAITADGIVKQTVKHSYDNILPSLNLRYELTDKQVIRFGLAKTMSRPRMDEMNASFSINLNNTQDQYGNYWSASGGNTNLEPKEAVGLDLTYENYFADDGYFALALYQKNIESWIHGGSDVIDISNFLAAVNETAPDGSTTATIGGQSNGGDGKIRGYEVSLSLPLNQVADALDGFGVFLSHTQVWSNLNTPGGGNYVLPGLSEEIQQATVYYENAGFEARVSMRKREDFKGDLYGLGFSVQQYDISGESIWDAQLGYNFENSGIEQLQGLRVYFQGINLTDEPFVSGQGWQQFVRDYQEYGVNYRLGFNYNF